MVLGELRPVEHPDRAVVLRANECYVAGIMGPKTLGELCADRGADGANLKERIAALPKRS